MTILFFKKYYAVFFFNPKCCTPLEVGCLNQINVIAHFLGPLYLLKIQYYLNLALKGLHIPGQGNALVKLEKIFSPVRHTRQAKG